MPYTQSAGHQIHYTCDGSGPPMVLQHGLLSSAQNWHDAGYVNVFAQQFTVICVDSIAHGNSDTSSDPSRYAQHMRVQDICAVMDALGHDKAHVLGYSMGGWIAAGMALYAPERLSSLGIGGWDCVNGMNTVADLFGVELSFDALLAGAQAFAPELTAQVNDTTRGGLQSCFDALSTLDGNAKAVSQLQVPVLLWDGRDDPYHDPMQLFAQQNGFGFLSVAGDHFKAMVDNGSQNAEALTVALNNP